MNSEKAPPDSSKATEILQAAARLFRDKGYVTTSVRDIAQAVGMQSGSIFYYFKTKEDILLAVMRESLRLITAAVLQARAAFAEPLLQLQAMIAAHLHVLLEEGDDFSVIFFDEWKSLSAAGKKEVGILRDRYEAIWKEVILRLQEEGRVTADMDVFRLFLLGGLNATVYWYRKNGRLSPDAIAGAVFKIVLPKGAWARSSC